MPGLPAKQATCHPEQKHLAKGLCVSCYHKAKWPEWYEQNREKIKARARNYYHRVRKHLPEEKVRGREKSRRQRLDNPEKMKAYMRARHLKLTYGITVEECRELFERNGGKCWICNERPAEHIDHCHETGKVRGALCHQCNVGIGYLDDDVGLLLKAVQYLKTGKVVAN